MKAVPSPPVEDFVEGGTDGSDEDGGKGAPDLSSSPSFSFLSLFEDFFDNVGSRLFVISEITLFASSSSISLRTR